MTSQVTVQSASIVLKWETCRYRLNARLSGPDDPVDFEGRNYEISATARKSVTIVHHPERRFSVVEELPKTDWPIILGEFTL